MNAIGFLIVELFSYLTIAFDFNELLGISVAYGISFFATFIINSLLTLRSGISDHPQIPYNKFHQYVVSGIAATAGYILLQFFLFTDLNINPLIGNIVGGAFITPINYYYRMRKVWGKDVLFGMKIKRIGE